MLQYNVISAGALMFKMYVILRLGKFVLEGDIWKVQICFHKTLVRPTLEYPSIIGDPHIQTQTSKLDKVT